MRRRLPEEPLKTYKAYSQSAGSEEGALLVFAHTAREAKKVAYPELDGWGILNRLPLHGDWMDVAVKRLWDKPHLYRGADQGKLAHGIPHVNDMPETCKLCMCWGDELDENGCCKDTKACLARRM